MKLEQYFSKLINSSIFEFPYNIQFLRTYENSLFKFRYHSFRILFPIREENTFQSLARESKNTEVHYSRTKKAEKHIQPPFASYFM